MTEQLPFPRAKICRDLLGLGLGAFFLFTMFLGSRDLWNPNEPLYGRAVAEMAEQGNWLLPTVKGEIFDEKPILYFWLALASSKLLGGVDEFSLRLPSALAGVLSVLMVYLLVYPYAGLRRARLAAALLGTTSAIFWTSRSVQMDLLVGSATLAAILAITRVLDHGLEPRRGWCLAGLAVGLGFLAKGPIGFICPVLVVVLYMVSTGRLGELRPGAFFIFFAMFFLIALPWFLILWARGETDTIAEMLYHQNFARFLNPWDHNKPWWYYVANFWQVMAPWGFFMPLALSLPGRNENERKIDCLAWIWVASIIVFFSFSKSKRAVYILPGAPAVSILVSGVAHQMHFGLLGKWRRRVGYALLGVFGGILLVAGVYGLITGMKKYPLPGFAGEVFVILLLVGGLGVLVGLLVFYRVPNAVPAVFFVWLVSFYLVLGSWVFPAVDFYKSARPFTKDVKVWVAPESPLRSYRLWRWRASYSYYMNQSIQPLNSKLELEIYWKRNESVFLIVEDGRLAEVQSIIGDIEPLVARSVGSQRVFLFSNRKKMLGTGISEPTGIKKKKLLLAPSSRNYRFSNNARVKGVRIRSLMKITNQQVRYGHPSPGGARRSRAAVTVPNELMVPSSNSTR